MKKALLLLLICFHIELSGQTLTNAQVYDYIPGDVFQWTHTDIYDMGIPCWLPSISIYHTDSIVSKYYSVASDTVFYSVFFKTYTPQHCNPTLPPSYSSGTITKYYTNLSALVFDTALMQSCLPETDTFYVSYCGKNVWEYHSNGDTCFEAPEWTSTAIEGCGVYGNYRGGYGGEPHYTQTLTYYKKAGVPCGTYSTVGIKENSVTADIDLYPNPNNGIMNFRYSIAGSALGNLVIYDISGRTIAEYVLQQGTNNQLKISETELNSGIYFYKMIVDKEIKASDKIVIIK